MNMEEIDQDLESEENEPEDNEDQDLISGKRQEKISGKERGKRVEGMDRPGRLQGFEVDDGKVDAFDMSDLDKLIDADDSAIMTEDFNLDVPHWQFETAALLNAVHPLSHIVKDSQELVAKTVLLEPDHGVVVLKVNTGEILAEIRVPLTNKTNVLQNSYVVEFKTLWIIVKNSGAKAVLYEENDGLKVKVLGGEVEFEKYSIDRQTYKQIPEGIESQGSLIPADQFMLFAHRSLRVMPLASRSEDRRIRVDDDLAYCSFLTTVVSIPSLGVNTSFRSTDLQFLSRLAEEAGFIKYQPSEKWNYFTSTNFRIAIPKILTDDLQGVKTHLVDLKKTSQFILTPIQFHRVLSVLQGIAGKSSVIKMKIEDSNLFLVSQTNTGKVLKFPVASAGDAANLELSVPSSTMISIAMLMRKETTTSVGINQEGQLIFESDSIKVLLGQMLS